MGRGEAAAVRRRYLILTATRWLPTGLLIPLIAVVPLERGLSLVDVGIVSAVGGTVVLLLELPTGGLADVLGRRPVLLVASACNLAGIALMVVAETFTAFLIIWCIEGIYRALESGPLDAWYVDSAQAADPAADIEQGLATRGLVLSVAIGVGALASGGIALLPQPDALPALALPIVVSLILRLVDGAALLVLLGEDAPPRSAGRRVTRVVATVRDTGRVVGESSLLLRGSTALLALAAAELVWGAGMAGVEIFAAPRMVDLLGDPGRGVFVFALAATVAWSISGVGSSAAPWLARRTGSWVNAAIITRVAQGAGVLAAGVIAGPAGLLTGYTSFYLFHGAANVAHYGLVNRNVAAAHRTTVLSINSLTSRLGGVVAAPLLGMAAAGAGLPLVFVICAALLASGGPLYLLARPPRTSEQPAGATAS
ncbi:MAG TPA: MFS transporter [Euzebya sp.]|nr:MFS transporter [Euzebya sp.]